MAEDKFKEDLMKEFNKEFADSPLQDMSSSEYAKVPGWVTTGNYALNWIASKDMFKGLPLGRVILFSGDPGSGKSMISLSMMREPSIDYIIYFDSEGGGISEDFAKFLGIDPAKVMYTPIETIEGLISRFKRVIDTLEKNKTKKKILMVVDSVSMLSTEKELDPNAGADMGNKAKLTRSFFRQYIHKMQKLNICAVMTGHLTETIGGYGPSKVVTGGTVLGYAPSIEIRFAVVNANSEVEKSAKGAKMIKIRAEIHKSRFGTTKKRVLFDLDMEKGLDPYAGLSDILQDYEFLIPASSDVETQLEKKEIPKRRTGYYVFKTWDPLAKKIQERLEAEKLVTENKKFREGKIKEWAEGTDWFLHALNDMMNQAHEDEVVVDEDEENVNKTESAESEESIQEDESPKKKTKKSKVEITDISTEKETA